MKTLNEYQLKNVSFSDCPIINESFDFIRREFQVEMKDLYLALDGGNWLGMSRVIIRNWKSFSSRLYIAKNKQWKDLSENNLDLLREVCEFEYGNKIIFKGFGKKTGQWVEFIFEGAELTIATELG